MSLLVAVWCSTLCVLTCFFLSRCFFGFFPLASDDLVLSGNEPVLIYLFLLSPNLMCVYAYVNIYIYVCIFMYIKYTCIYISIYK